jgi:hypothetical protein
MEGRVTENGIRRDSKPLIVITRMSSFSPFLGLGVDVQQTEKIASLRLLVLS